MSDRRRQEIEEKRAKLAELRRARDERKQLLAQAEKGSGLGSAEVSPYLLLPFSRYANTYTHQPLTTNRRDVNELVDSLLARPATPLTGPSSTRPSTIGTPARPSGSTPPASIPGTPGGRVSRLSNDGSLSRAAGSTVGRTSIGVPGNIDQCVKVG